MWLTRSSATAIFAAALFLGAAADNSQVRRAAALLDYIARGYPAAVSQGQVVNAPEYDEQQAFAQEVIEALPGSPLEPEARKLLQQIQAKAAGAESLAASLHARLLQSAGLSTTPPPDVLLPIGAMHYQQACAACHGADGRGDGFAAADLPTRATDFTGPDRDQLTPYRVFAAIAYGVPHTAMPAFGDMTDERKWQIALYTLTFGHAEEDARRGEALARARGLLPQAPQLLAKSDAELRRELGARFSPGDAKAILAWLRRIAPFAGPPPAGFPDLRQQVVLASSLYVHQRWQDAQRVAREAELGGWLRLVPLARAAAPERAGQVRGAFAELRTRLSQQGTGQNTRVLGAAAQLTRVIALAGPEEQPEPPVLRRAGEIAALFDGWPAALALCAAIALALRQRAPGAAASARTAAAAGPGAIAMAAGAGLIAAIAGSALGALRAWPWQAALGAQIGCAVAMAFALAGWRRWAAAGAGLAAFAAGAEIAASCAAVLEVFPQAPPSMAHAALFASALLAAAAAAAALLLRRAPRALAAASLLASLFWAFDRARLLL